MVVRDRDSPEWGIAGLTFGEHLLVWSWRKIVAGGGGCPLIAREFSLSCGEDASEVLATLYTFLQALAYAGRRRLEVGYPGYTSVTTDEWQMLVLIATAQRDDATLKLICESWPAPRYVLRSRLLLVRSARLSMNTTCDCRCPREFHPRLLSSRFNSGIMMIDGSLRGSKGNTVGQLP
jgi:hypothetical protein